MATSYATLQDFEDFGLPAQALAGIEESVRRRHLELASGRIDSYMHGQETLPLVKPYPLAVVECCVILACYSLLTVRGFNSDEYDENFRERYTDMVGDGINDGWLDKLSKGQVSLGPAADATPNKIEGAPQVSSSPSRGWDTTVGNSQSVVGGSGGRGGFYG